MFTCPACGIVTRHRAWWRVICNGCTGRLAEAAGDLADLLGDLDDAVGRRVVMGGGGGSARSEHPLPFDPVASDVADDVRLALAWVASEGRRFGGRAPVGSRNRARWVRARAREFARLRSAPAVLAMLRDAARAVVRTVDRPPALRYIGPCFGCQAPITTHDPPPREVECKACGEKWGGPELLAVNTTTAVEARRDEHVTIRELAHIATVYTGATVPYERVKKWAQRGHVPRGDNGYRVGDLVDYLNERASK